MKKDQILMLFLLSFMAIVTQAQMVSNNNDDEVNKVDQYVARAYRPGEVIVKFKEATPVKMRSKASGKFQSSGVSKVDNVLNSLGVTEADQLMPRTGNKVRRSIMRSYSGEEVKDRDMSGLYRLRFDAKAAVSVEQAVKQLKELDEVEYAEPNYLVFIMSTDADSYTAEPLYTEQWGPAAINLDQLWAAPKLEGAKRPVIAILDTGIDITHPDLAANIWTNPAEGDGAEGEDDDNNGFNDDVHGWDFINQTPKMADYNGHGTHCAGIAAAVGDNGIGITGANPDAYIMPITVMQSDGTGDVATIIQGIDYATDNGATFLSMSFGGYTYSIAEEQALAKAYSKATLVAAAGNNGWCIYYSHHQPNLPGPCFPAAFTFVLGVEAANESGRAGFSNWDCDGPIYSNTSMSSNGDEFLHNYELRVPGVNIFSTYPQGRYKSMNGTSMACPLAAGAISRLMQCKSYEYQVINREILFGDLIHGANQGTGIMDVLAAYNIKDEDREPTLWLVSTELNDEAEGDGDFRPDAGEIIDLYPTLRNDWGNATNIKLHLGVGENEDETIIECITNDVDFGKNLSSYGKAKSDNPIRFKIRDNCADNRHIRLSLSVTCDEIPNPIVYDDIVIVVENGVEISGMIDHDMTLYPNVHYIVTDNIAIPEGVCLTIKPGSKIDIKCGKILINGDANIKGTADSTIVFQGNGGGIGFYNPSWEHPKDTLKYCIFYDMFTNPDLGDYTPPVYDNCIFDWSNRYNESIGSFYIYAVQSNIINYKANNGFGVGLSVANELKHSNCANLIDPNCVYEGNGYIPRYQKLNCCNMVNINFGGYSIGSPFGEIAIDHSDNPSWLGTSKEDIIRPYICEIGNSATSFTSVDLSNMPTRPYKEAHGIVWKVVVDGYDAQDEFDQLPPLGVGRHKFEVYFNRDDMDTTITPTLAMGVRPPYTQIGIAEDGFWSVKDSVSVYTAYLNITGKLQADGLNRIYVSGAKDGEHFEIPYENTRFNVLVQAAGSMATGFEAEAGMGNVKLTWNNENNDFEDAMGFNVYRYTMLNDSVAGDTIRLNQTILDIEATEYTDYEVTPGETYYYYYKVLSTDLKEYDISNVVAATPLTSTLGDANASGEVDVADVITTVNYAAGMEPRPFIFEAADVNADQDIDILDVIGIIKIITRPNAAATASIEGCAIYSIEDGIVWVDSPIDLAGVQLTLNAGQDATITATETLNGFEQVGAWMDENSYLFLAYNMGGRVIPAGKQPILNIGDAEITDIRLSDRDGHNILATPAEEVVTGIGVLKPEVQKSRMQGIYDMTGRRVAASPAALDRLPRGIYIVNGVKVVK